MKHANRRLLSPTKILLFDLDIVLAKLKLKILKSLFATGPYSLKATFAPFMIKPKSGKKNQGLKYFRLKYWDGHNWIVPFIKADDTDWIALTENHITGMIHDKVIEKASPEEQLDAIIMEGKNEAGGWKFKFSP